MLFVSQKLLNMFLEDDFINVSSEENIKNIHFLGCEVKDCYEIKKYFSFFLKEGKIEITRSLDTKVNLINFSSNVDKNIFTTNVLLNSIESLSSDIVFQIETTKHTQHLSCLPLFLKELFFLQGFSYEDFKSNLNKVFLNINKGLKIENDNLNIDEKILSSIDKIKIFNICNYLQIPYSGDIKKDLYKISFFIFGYKIDEKNFINRIFENFDELFLSFISTLSTSQTKDINSRKLICISKRKQIMLFFEDITSVTKKKIDIVNVLKNLKLFGYELIIDINNKTFFVSFPLFLFINSKEKAIEEILRVNHKFLELTYEKLKNNLISPLLRKEICEHLICNKIKEVNTLPFVSEGYSLINPINKKNNCIRETLYFNLKNKKESVFEISSIFNEYNNKVLSFQFIGIYEKYPGNISNKFLMNILFYTSSESKTFFDKKKLSIEYKNNFLSLYTQYCLLFRQKIEKDFIFTEINLSLLNTFKISPKDLYLSQIFFSKTSYKKYIDVTFEQENNILSFWNKIFEVLRKNEKKIFLKSFSNKEKSSFTVRYYFANEKEYIKFKKRKL